MSLISREDAIKELMSLLPKLDRGLIHWTGVKAMLEALPQAQPEIIYCKDCKYAKDVLDAIRCDKNGGYYNPVHHFCSMAERRNKEGEK